MSEKIIVKYPDGCYQEHEAFMNPPKNEVVLKAPEGKQIIVSDGYHSFEELYDHRIELFIALCRKIKDYGAQPPYGEYIWRSLKHSDGSSILGLFVMGIQAEKEKQITYHLPTNRWQDCNFADELEQAPEWDGHTSADVLERLKNL